MKKSFLNIPFFITLVFSCLISCTSDQTQTTSAILYLQNEDTYILELPAGEIQNIASGVVPESWSPSGLWILLKSEGQIHILNKDSSIMKSTFFMQGLACPQLEEAVWLNDNIVLLRASAGAESCLYAYSVPEEQIFHEEEDFEGFDLLPSPDGRVWIQRTLNGLVLRNLEGDQTALDGLQLSYLPGLSFDLAFS
ncbi:MAG: hypothetical protein JXA25_14300, partial [Anaerolineales bacterium]|nr:hypothetical protein [Anaerolineales bacterium]